MYAYPTTVAKYLASLPPDRRRVVAAVRDVIRKNLGPGYEETMRDGEIHYFVPYDIFPPGDLTRPNRPLEFAGVVGMTTQFSVYLYGTFLDPKETAWLAAAYKKAGKTLDVSKSRIRFRSLDEMPLAVLGEAIRRMPIPKMLTSYHEAWMGRAQPATTTKTTKTKAAAKRKPAKPTKRAKRTK